MDAVMSIYDESDAAAAISATGQTTQSDTVLFILAIGLLCKRPDLGKSTAICYY